MKLTQLKAPAFEGRDIDVKLTAANLITAPPEVGKTSIVNAAQVAMYGHLPSLGETHSATFGLSSNPRELFVRGTFDDGTQNAVTISRDENGSCTKSVSMAHQFPLCLMDANEYFSLTGKERLAYVLRRVNLRKCGYSDAQLLEKMFEGLDKSETVTKWDTAIGDSWHARDKDGTPLIDWLDALVERLANALSAARKDAKVAKGVIDTLKVENPPQDVSAAFVKAKADLQAAIQAEASYNAKSDRKVLAEKVQSAISHLRECETSADWARGALENITAPPKKSAPEKHCPTCTCKTAVVAKDRKAEEKAAKVELTKAESALKSAQDSLDDARKALLACDQKSAQDNKLSKLSVAVADLKKIVSSLESRNTEWTSYQSNLAKLNTAKSKLKEAQDESTVVKHLADALQSYQAQIVEKAFAQLLKTVNQFTTGILRAPLVYHDGELRFENYPDWTTRRTFSGTQRMLVYAGLQVALCQDSPMKLVAIDEFGVCPPDFKQRIASRLLELVQQQVIDQFMLCDCQKDWLVGPLRTKINVIELT